jgi:Tfp pilus assembly protein PilF
MNVRERTLAVSQELHPRSFPAFPIFPAHAHKLCVTGKFLPIFQFGCRIRRLKADSLDGISPDAQEVHMRRKSGRLPVGTLGLAGWLAICVGAWRVGLAQDASLTPNLPPAAPPAPAQTSSAAAVQDTVQIPPAASGKVPANDPISLSSPAKPGVELYVAVARLYEETGRLSEAEDQYKKGLKVAPGDLRALLGYARLKDRTGQADEALNLYREAVKAHPREPAVYNNMAVHYAHRGMLPMAAKAMRAAIQLRPQEVKYRDNIATVLIQLDRPQEAFEHLCAVHDEATAHYDLGFLMMKIQQRQAAELQFSLALRINPSLVPARQWLDRLHGRPGAAPAMIGPTEPRPGAPPQVAIRTSPLPEQFGPPPPPPSGDGVREPASWQQRPPEARSLVPPPGASWSDPTVVVVRPSSARPEPPRSPQPSDAVATQPLPPASPGDGAAAVTDLPRFPNPLREDSPAQVAPMPPDAPHAPN